MQCIGKMPVHFISLGGSQKRPLSEFWKVGESLGFLRVAKGRDPCRAQSFRQGKPPSARYGGHVVEPGIMQPSAGHADARSH